MSGVKKRHCLGVDAWWIKALCTLGLATVIRCYHARLCFFRRKNCIGFVKIEGQLRNAKGDTISELDTGSLCKKEPSTSNMKVCTYFLMSHKELLFQDNMLPGTMKGN